MAIAPAAIAWIGAGLAAVGTVASISQQREARKDQRRAAERQNAARAEQAAQQSAESAQARRQQMREARIKRAQILQASENTGTAFSSGEGGALGSIATQLGSNIGLSQGNIERSQRIGNFNQAAADFQTSAQTHANRAGFYSQVGQLGLSMVGDAQNISNKTKKTVDIFTGSQ